MSLTAAAIRLMADRGLSALDIAEIAEACEPKRNSNAERQARFRERRRNDSNVTSNALPPPIEDHTPPSSSQPSVSKKARALSFIPPEGVSLDQWQNLMACRKAKRAAMTEGAYRQICRKLKDGAEAGWPPGELVDRAVERGWTTVFIPEESPNGRMVGNSGQGTGRGEHPGRALLREAEAELALEAEREAQSRH